MSFEVVSKISAEEPQGSKKVTFNLVSNVYEKFIADQVTGRRTLAAAVLRAVETAVRIDALQQQDQDEGGEGYIYLAPASDPEKRIHIFSPL